METLRKPRLAALLAIAVITAAASVTSFAESYHALFLWSTGHGLAGFWAWFWPLQIDVFIAVGEMALFVALADRWPATARYPAWAVTGLGLGASVAANVGHVSSPDLTWRLTAAVPPIAAAATLAVALGILKRIVAYSRAEVALPVVAEPAQFDPDATSVFPAIGGGPGRYASIADLPDSLLERARETFAEELRSGAPPGMEKIRVALNVGQRRAQLLRDYLAIVARDGSYSPVTSTTHFNGSGG